MNLHRRGSRGPWAVMAPVGIGLGKIWERPWIGRLDDGKVRNGGSKSELDLEVDVFLLNMIPNFAM